ncbi:MAG: outer membrane beta-barrel protein [Chitinophagaceae bacterium]
MQNLHDDNHLDDLSRDAADHFEPDQQLHSWNKLHARLEKELPVEKEKKRRYFFILFFFLLVGGGVIFSAIWSSNSKDVQKQVAVDNKAADHKAADKTSAQKSGDNDPASDKAGGGSGNSTAPIATNQAANPSAGNQKITTDPGTATTNPQPVKTNDHKNDPAIKANTITPTVASSGNPSVVRQSARTQQDRNQQNRLRNNVVKQTDHAKKNNITDNSKRNTDNKISIVKDNSSVTTPPPADKKVPDHTADNKVAETKTDAPQNNSVSKDAKEDNKPALDQPVIDEQKIADKPAGKDADKTTVAVKKTPSESPSVSASRWEFGLVYGPDLSTVKFTHTQKPGTNLGLMIGYNISRRFSVQAGALYTLKNYKSRGEDYHPPKGYWTDYVKLETVTADCNMWDIPVNLRYNIIPKKSANLFASAGLSSYLMNKEDYDFFYYYNGNPVSRYRSLGSQSKDWFSVLNLSIGYERQLNKNFSVQAEPFFKQSLKGVGFGNVKLNSTGVFLSVKYKPVAGKRSK